jgi:hypothetical protein
MMIQSAAIIFVCTVALALADAVGFTQATQVWRGGVFAWSPAIKSAISFTIGIPLYWWVIYHLDRVGVSAPELQVSGYFAVTIVLVAILSGRFATWALSDKIVAVVVLIGLLWLVARVEA